MELVLPRAAPLSYRRRAYLESRIGMSPETDSIASHADARPAAGKGARATRLCKTMMMPITTPIEAGRTRAS